MAADPRHELTVDWKALNDAARACDREADGLAGPIGAFERDACPTQGNFGLIEDGSAELYRQYRSFFEETRGFVRDLSRDLEQAADRLHDNSGIYRRAEEAAGGRG